MAEHPEERPWTCAIFRGTDGSTIFRGGVGHSLVVDPAGGLWRARSYEDFDTTYLFTDGSCEIDTLTPRYAHLREYPHGDMLAVFDLDGTLSTTNEVDSECFVAAVRAEFGFTPESDWSAYEHCPDEGIAVEALTGYLGQSPNALQLNRLKRRFVDLLASAAAAKPHLYSRCGRARVAPTPRRFRLDPVHCHGCLACPSRSQAQGRRPSRIDPAVLLRRRASREAILGAAMAHGRAIALASVSRVVAVGDGVWDVAAAANLALPFLGVGRGPHAARLCEAGALAVVPDFLRPAGNGPSPGARAASHFQRPARCPVSTLCAKM